MDQIFIPPPSALRAYRTLHGDFSPFIIPLARNPRSTPGCTHPLKILATHMLNVDMTLHFLVFTVNDCAVDRDTILMRFPKPSSRQLLLMLISQHCLVE